MPTLRHHDQRLAEPPPELGSTSLLDYAADLEAEIGALEHPPILIGHSMGGLLAQMLAARGLASAVVCLTPAPPMGILALRRPSVFLAFSTGTVAILQQKPVKISYRAARFAVLNRLSEAESLRVYEQGVWESGRAISEIGLRTYGRLVPYFDPARASEVDERNVTGPMLVIGARHDRITPLPIADKVARKYNADFKQFDAHGHWVLGEPGWESVAGFVADWLSEHARADRPPP